jgi:hypothetical protein
LLGHVGPTRSPESSSTNISTRTNHSSSPTPAQRTPVSMPAPKRACRTKCRIFDCSRQPSRRAGDAGCRTDLEIRRGGQYSARGPVVGHGGTSGHEDPLLNAGPALATSGGVAKERRNACGRSPPPDSSKSAPRSARGSQGRAEPGASASLTAPGIFGGTLDTKLAPRRACDCSTPRHNSRPSPRSRPRSATGAGGSLRSWAVCTAASQARPWHRSRGRSASRSGSTPHSSR